jgi:hypothetical protein
MPTVTAAEVEEDSTRSGLYPRTGQTSCHDTAGRVMSCAGTGQDAEIGAGCPWPEPRFETSGAVALDRLTGLTWTRDANVAELPVTWPEALGLVAAMNSEEDGRGSRWRLPNRRELRSLMSHQNRLPALPEGHPFENVFSGWYWTSTTAAIAPAYAWYVHTEGARMFYGNKEEYHLLWPVRGEGNGILAATGQTLCHDASGGVVSCAGTGQDGEMRSGRPWPQPRFEVAGDTVVDCLTRLRWMRSANLTLGEVTWSEALAAVDSLNLADPAVSDGEGGAVTQGCQSREIAGLQLRRRWRLPNIVELESLVDCSTHSPALPDHHPFTDVREDYWSATTSMFEPDWAWALYLAKGALGVGQKKGRTFSVWAVSEAK